MPKGTLRVVEEILEQAREPLSVKEIIERAGPRLPTRSKSPPNVVHRDLSMDIKYKQGESKFVRTAPGRYALREYAD